MKFLEPWGSQRLSCLLEKAASREAKVWRMYVPKKPTSQDTDISPAQRDEAVRWLTELHGKLQLYPETLVLAVSILDRFLAPIKARPKYLRCIAIACFFLAAKTCEEDERVPSLKELAASSSCGCSPSEILRMERLVLDKLNWDLHTATALDFLHILENLENPERRREKSADTWRTWRTWRTQQTHGEHGEPSRHMENMENPADTWRTWREPSRHMENIERTQQTHGEHANYTKN